MRNLYLPLSRYVAGIMGVITLWGLLFFSSTLKSEIVTAGLVLGSTSFVVALMPQRILRLFPVRLVFVLLCLAGVAAGLVLLFYRLGRADGVEWHVVSASIIHIAALATLAIFSIGVREKTGTDHE